MVLDDGGWGGRGDRFAGKHWLRLGFGVYLWVREWGLGVLRSLVVVDPPMRRWLGVGVSAWASTPATPADVAGSAFSSVAASSLPADYSLLCATAGYGIQLADGLLACFVRLSCLGLALYAGTACQLDRLRIIHRPRCDDLVTASWLAAHGIAVVGDYWCWLTPHWIVSP